jgi:Domain of unknown function (DUF4294)
MKSRHFVFWVCLGIAALWGTTLSAQTADTLRSGGWARLEVTGNDSVYVMSLNPARVLGRRFFKDFGEQRQYYLYLRAAKKVYPYAIQAVNLYKEIETETQEMRKGQRRRYIKKQNSELKDEFKEQLKNFSRTEGKVLIKMIEREVNKPFYQVISETKGGMTALYWHNLGKIWGYDLKDGYKTGADPLLDEILTDYDFGRLY